MYILLVSPDLVVRCDWFDLDLRTKWFRDSQLTVMPLRRETKRFAWGEAPLAPVETLHHFLTGGDFTSGGRFICTRGSKEDWNFIGYYTFLPRLLGFTLEIEYEGAEFEYELIDPAVQCHRAFMAKYLGGVAPPAPRS